MKDKPFNWDDLFASAYQKIIESSALLNQTPGTDYKPLILFRAKFAGTSSILSDNHLRARYEEIRDLIPEAYRKDFFCFARVTHYLLSDGPFRVANTQEKCGLNAHFTAFLVHLFFSHYLERILDNRCYFTIVSMATETHEFNFDDWLSVLLTFFSSNTTPKNDA